METDRSALRLAREAEYFGGVLSAAHDLALTAGFLKGDEWAKYHFPLVEILIFTYSRIGQAYLPNPGYTPHVFAAMYTPTSDISFCTNPDTYVRLPPTASDALHLGICADCSMRPGSRTCTKRQFISSDLYDHCQGATDGSPSRPDSKSQHVDPFFNRISSR